MANLMSARENVLCVRNPSASLSMSMPNMDIASEMILSSLHTEAALAITVYV